jgi:hypothetical protein
MKCNACSGSGKRPLEVNGAAQLLMCANCLGSGERQSPAMGQPTGNPGELRSGEQSPSAEELEIDRLRADNRHMREALTSIACRASDPFCAQIAMDTLKRVLT